MLCYGFKRDRFQELTDSRRWDNDRKDVSKVRFVGNRLFARECNGRKMESEKFRCWHCFKALKSLQFMRYRLRKRPTTGTTESNRLLYSKIGLLSVSDLKRKARLCKIDRDGRKRKRNDELDKLRRRLREAAAFVPIHEENRSAVLSIVTYLNAETERHRHPKCGWFDGDGARCEFEAVSADRLLNHVNNIHMVEQKKSNALLEPLKRSYRCCWNTCRRRQPFKTWKNVYNHLKEHTGSAETKRLLEVVRNQLVNAGRSLSGRRYVQVAKDLALAKYRSRKSWQLSREYSGLPMISGATIRRLKNMDEVTTGIWVETLARMNKIAETRPFVRHGILICDEVKFFLLFSRLFVLTFSFFFRFTSASRYRFIVRPN